MTQGIHHLGITVECLEEAKAFFVDLLEWKFVKENPNYPSIFVSDGMVMLSIWKAKIEQAVAFDRAQNIGLHHFALKVDSENELSKIHNKVKESGYKIEFAPEPLGQGPAQHFMMYGPSKIRIEFIHAK